MEVNVAKFFLFSIIFCSFIRQKPHSILDPAGLLHCQKIKKTLNQITEYSHNMHTAIFIVLIKLAFTHTHLMHANYLHNSSVSFYS